MSTKKVILIVFIVLVILIALSFWTGKQMSKLSLNAPGSTPISSGSWLHLDPGAYIPEYSELLPFNLFGTKELSSMQNLVAKIRSAKDDKRIDGIFIEPMGMQISMASMNELGLAIQDFKSSGKPVLAFGDMMSQADYLLASYADEIYMDPSASAGLLLTGAAANITFYKELFDKIGIKMHVVQSGEYKGAGEPYTQTSLSEGTRANIAEAISDRFDLIIDAIAQRRELTRDDVLAVYQGRTDLFISAQQALELKLIEAAGSRKELCQKHNIDEDKLVRVSAYSAKENTHSGDIVAVVYLEGQIMGGNASMGQALISHNKVQKVVEDIQNDSSVKAAVIRVNSPGGSALESEYIYRELSQLNAKIPVVISMGGTAASGGYYISCAGRYVVADSSTITGSIGVVMMIPEATGLSRKIGVRSQTIRYGKYAGVLNPLEPYSAELIASLRRNSEDTYNEFKSRVMTARNISPDKINSLAEGRIFSAEDALALNLIDEVGTLDNAIAKAAELASITSYSAKNFPRKKSVLEFLRELDITNLQALSLLKGKQFNLQMLTETMLTDIEPYKWLYLMPVGID